MWRGQDVQMTTGIGPLDLDRQARGHCWKTDCVLRLVMTRLQSCWQVVTFVPVGVARQNFAANRAPAWQSGQVEEQNR
jgi:hypothetical protein